MTYKLGKVLLTREEIAKRVDELADSIASEYRGKELVVVGIMKGAVIFMADLVRVLGERVDVKMDFMAVSSYGQSTESSGVVKIVKDIDSYIEDKHVMIVEDIVDSGRTLVYLRELMTARKTASFKTCVLLEKPERLKVPVKIDYMGFTIPNEFVVGYGLDYAGQWRHLPDIHIVVEE